MCVDAFCRSVFDFRLKVFEASYQEGVTERWGFWEPCTEDALLNSEESDKDVLRHRTEDQQLRKKTCEVTEHLRRQGCVAENTVADRITEDSVELCQVGIERVYRGAQRKELCWEFKGTESLRILRSSAKWALSKCIGAQKKNSAVSSEDRITEDSESSARRALSRCKGCTGGNRTVERVLWKRRYSARRASRKCASRHRRGRELFEFWNLKEESTEGSSLGYWIPRRLKQEVAWAEG
jgi:hypothetical protein